MQTTANVAEGGDNRMKRQVKKRIALPDEPDDKTTTALRRVVDIAATFRQMQRGKTK